MRAIHNWFVETVGLRRVASPTVIWYRFTEDDLNMMPVPEYIDFIRDWAAEGESR